MGVSVDGTLGPGLLCHAAEGVGAAASPAVQVSMGGESHFRSSAPCSPCPRLCPHSRIRAGARATGAPPYAKSNGVPLGVETEEAKSGHAGAPSTATPACNRGSLPESAPTLKGRHNLPATPKVVDSPVRRMQSSMADGWQRSEAVRAACKNYELTSRSRSWLSPSRREERPAREGDRS